jgi:hypothetical protein
MNCVIGGIQLEQTPVFCRRRKRWKRMYGGDSWIKAGDNKVKLSP